MSVHSKKTEPLSAVIQLGDSQNLVKNLNAHNLFMAACCLAIIIGIGTILFAGSPNEMMATKALTALPLIACVAMHFVTHRFIEKSCHTRNSVKKNHGLISGSLYK